jgi:hypothetical protein
MASIISAGTTSGTALNMAGDTSGVLQLATNGSTTAITIDTSQRAAFVAGTAALPAITTTGDTNTGIFFPAADTIAFTEGGTEAMRLDASGNVGIGTATPGYKLSVNSPNGINSYDGVAGKGRFVLGDPADPNGYVGMYRSVASTIGTSGNDLTIGCLSAIAFTTGGSTFSTQTERMRLDISGNVLVATTNTASFTQTGTLFIGDRGAVDPIQIYRNSTGASGQIGFNNPNGRVGEIYTSGSGTTYATSSDYRLKENVAPMTGALDKVAQLKPVTYKWKVDGSDGQGFIAHELQAVIPDCVSGDKDAVDAEGKPVYQGVDTSFLVATLTAAIQEQQTIINDLKARITALEGAA